MKFNKKYIILCLMAVIVILIMLNLTTIYRFFEQLVSFQDNNAADYDITLEESLSKEQNGLEVNPADTEISDQASGDKEDTDNLQGELLSIEGVDFPVRESFLTPSTANSDWGGAFSSWLELELALDHRIIDTTDLIISSDKIEFTHAVAGSEGVTLTKTKSGYNISLSVKLSGSVLAEQNAAIVKAMVVTISSEPTKVYNAIYESFTSDKTHGITKKKYKKIGDCKIKLQVQDGVVSYLIVKAK